ncbi:squalene/phytoene synthase family protein [Roseinatronobacter sp. NSM]|uniref:squalene/phytoene synthase family protein n=1 Tax=Roseinatronobacter sp. NSM TaxID=3457785 RepID=UPI0040363BF6
MDDLSTLVQQGDPDRYAATIAASDDARARLWPLYAFNLEVARAPWVTQEPLIAEMRLQFWTDVLDDIAARKPARAHHVAAPLAQVWQDAELPVALGHGIIAARQWDIYRAPFADDAAFRAYLDSTSGNLMWLAARALGASPQAEAPVRDMAFASGLANWLVAIPQLQAAGRIPLVDGRDSAVAALARDGLAHLARARAKRHLVPARALPALLTGWQAGVILRRAAQAPGLVAQDGLRPAEFRRRGALVLRALSGRW